MSRGAQIKKDDFELYKFFFSKENLNPSKVSKRVQMILEYRYADKMIFKAISEKMGIPMVEIRTIVRLFRRKAMIAKWYTEKVRKMNETNDDVS